MNSPMSRLLEFYQKQRDKAFRRKDAAAWFYWIGRCKECREMIENKC